MTTAELKIKEHQLDIAELKAFLEKATRDSVRKSIKESLDTTTEELSRLEKAEKQRLERIASNQTIGFNKKIETYGWDQSEKFVKIYITSLKDVNTVKESDVSSSFEEKSFDITVKNLNNFNYNLAIKNLCFKIVPEGSYFKLKKDMISVFLKKFDVGKEWPGITEKELKDTEKKMDAMPKMDGNADPQEGMMSMMKKMYDEGDDEMKRTISKSFMESREKGMNGGGAGGAGGMPDMGGMGGGMPGMGGMGGGAGGMPDLSKMMGGMGGGAGGAGGAGGKPDMASMMAALGGMGGGAGGAGGKPDMASMMAALGGMGGGAGGAGGEGGMPDMASMMAALGGKGGAGGEGGMPDMASMMAALGKDKTAE